MENSDGIIFDDWDDDLLLQIIEAETQAAEAALSSKSKTLSTNPSSSSNHQSQPQQQQQHHHQLQPIDVSVNNFSPPRELSQRPIIRFDSSPPKPISHVNNDIVIDRFKVIPKMGLNVFLFALHGFLSKLFLWGCCLLETKWVIIIKYMFYVR
jgi:hypothetical protein